MDNYIQTDQAADVSGSIRHALRTAQIVGEDPHAWKWLVLALHSALQGACVCHLTTTAEPVGAVTANNAAEWLKYFEVSRTDPNAKPPKTYLMPLPNLLKEVRRPHSAGDRSNAAGISISDNEMRRLKHFHDDIRNQFVHFEPMSWSIEVSGIPEIARLIARIIQDILKVGWAFRHMSCEEHDGLQSALADLAQAQCKRRLGTTWTQLDRMKFQGRRSSIWPCGWPAAMASRVALR